MSAKISKYFTKLDQEKKHSSNIKNLEDYKKQFQKEIPEKNVIIGGKFTIINNVKYEPDLNCEEPLLFEKKRAGFFGMKRTIKAEKVDEHANEMENMEILNNNYGVSTKKRKLEKSILLSNDQPNSKKQKKFGKDQLNMNNTKSYFRKMKTESNYNTESEIKSQNVSKTENGSESETTGKVKTKSKEMNENDQRVKIVKNRLTNSRNSLNTTDRNNSNNSASSGSPKFYIHNEDVIKKFNILGHNKFECQLCSNIITTKSYLRQHLNSHNKVLPKCAKCNKIFKTKYNKHVCPMDNKICTMCNKTFAFISSYRLHMKRFHPEKFSNEKTFDCDLCGDKFFGKTNIAIHLNLNHLQGRGDKFICDFDGKVFNNRSGIYNHMLRHFAKSVKCKVCSAEMKTFSIKQHMKTFHTENQFQCKVCPKSFKSLQYLKLHMNYHEKKFTCELCGKKYGHNFELARHIKFFHENPRSFHCKICKKRFHTAYTYRCHMKTHDENRPKPFKCSKCTFAVDKRCQFIQHMKFHEKMEAKQANWPNAVQCKTCMKILRNESILAKHIANVHPKMLYGCDYCGQNFKIKYNFLRHLKFVHKFYSIDL